MSAGSAESLADASGYKDHTLSAVRPRHTTATRSLVW